MSFKSKAQQGYMFAAAKRGEIPQHVKKQAYEDAKRGK
jgi:hypothetical protein